MTNRQLTFDSIDRVENLTYTPLERKYLKARYITLSFLYLCLMGLTPLLLFLEKVHLSYVIALEGVLFIAFIFNMWLLPRAFLYKGYAIREHDITYRSGLIFPTVTTIPFSKVQQVGIKQDPVTRWLGLYAVDIANGSQGVSGICVPGLTEERARAIKVLITTMIQQYARQ